MSRKWKAKLLRAAERGPLDPALRGNQSAMKRLEGDGYLRRVRSPEGRLLFERTDLPYVEREGDGFDFAAHRRRYAEI